MLFNTVYMRLQINEKIKNRIKLEFYEKINEFEIKFRNPNIK